MSTPDYMEPLIGWRKWTLAFRPYRLLSIAQEHTWQPFEAVHALHAVWDGGFQRCDHDFSNCYCGVYAYRTPADLREGMYGDWLMWNCGPRAPFVIGKIAMWGTVAIHERGYRASKAYPAEIVYVSEGFDGQAIADEYGIPFMEDRSWTSVYESEPSSWSPSRSPYQTAAKTGFSTPFGRSHWLNQFLPSRWTSQYLLHPDEHEFIVKSEEPKVPEYPGLPAGMTAPDIHPPKRYQRSESGLWLKGGEPTEDEEWGLVLPLNVPVMANVTLRQSGWSGFLAKDISA